MTAPVDVVVPVLDGAGHLRLCLDALMAQDGVEARVIVVDNGSVDGSPEVARGYPGVEVLTESSPGSYAARNRGLQEVTAPVVAFIDADCVPEPTWLREGLAALAASGADLVGGEIVQAPGVTAVGRWDSLTYLNQGRAVEVLGVAMTANLFARTEAVRGLGGFDARARSGGDWDLCLRAAGVGLRLAYSPLAVVRHAPREQLSAVVRRAWRIGRGGVTVLRRHPVLLRWSLSPRRLAPGVTVLRAAPRQPTLVIIDLIDRWITYLGRLVGLALTRRESE